MGYDLCGWPCARRVLQYRCERTLSVQRAGLVTDFVLPVAIGLVFVAIGVAVAYSFGKIKHVRAIAVWCFVIGCFSLPMLWIVVVVLAGLGLLSLD